MLSGFSSIRFDQVEELKRRESRSEFERMDEQVVWDEFIRGNEAAFIFIYDKYFDTLFKYGSQFTADRGLIKDAIQDVFLELINKRRKLSSTNSIKFYLFKSLKRAVFHILKRNRRLEFNDQPYHKDFQITLSVEHFMINKQLKEEKLLRIKKVMETLTKKQREILYYFYFENLSIKEIGQLMDFSNTKSAQNLLYKALKLLKEKIAEISIIYFVGCIV